MKIVTIPNVLTLFRGVVAVGLFLIGAFWPEHAYPLLMWVIPLMVFASVSDFLDGWIARNWPEQQSALGVIIDPIMDKALIIGAMFYIHALGSIGGYEYVCFGIIVLREIWMFLVRRIFGAHMFPVSKKGKRKAGVQMVALILYMGVPLFPEVLYIAVPLLSLAVILTLDSLRDYGFRGPGKEALG